MVESKRPPFTMTSPRAGASDWSVLTNELCSSSGAGATRCELNGSVTLCVVLSFPPVPSLTVKVTVTVSPAHKGKFRLTVGSTWFVVPPRAALATIVHW